MRSRGNDKLNPAVFSRECGGPALDMLPGAFAIPVGRGPGGAANALDVGRGPALQDVCAMFVSSSLLSPSRWYSMRQIERYHPTDPSD